MATLTHDFVATAGTLLESFSQGGVGWTSLSGSLEINPSGYVYGINTSAVYRNDFVPVNADYEVTSVCKLFALGSEGGITARMTSTSNMYLLRYTSGNIQLMSLTSGGNTVLGSYTPSPAIAINDIVTLKLRCVGEKISAYYNGVKVIDVTNTALTAKGYAGIRASSGFRIGNYTVTDFSSVPAGEVQVITPSLIGSNNVASGNFTIGLDGYIESNVTVNISATNGATVTPSSITFTPNGLEAPSQQTFTITPNTLGFSVISFTNTGALTNPSTISYEAIIQKPIVCDGNSLTVGSGYVTELQTIVGSRYRCINKGVNGQTTAQMITDFNTDILPEKLSVNSYLVAWEVTNDIYTGANATTAFNNIKNYCLLGKSAGFKVVVVDCMPRSNSGTPPTFEDSRNTVNENIKQHWSEFADVYVSLSDDTRLGQPGDETNSTYFVGDGVHLNATGGKLIAEKVAQSILLLESGFTNVTPVTSTTMAGKGNSYALR